jgi:hypothetical protein
MPIDLAASLPMLLPRAVAWAEASVVLTSGNALQPPELELARSVGVVKPEKIRIGVVDRLPLPTDAALRDAAVQTGLLGPSMIGLTLGYAVLICRGHEASTRLLTHEFRHVYQYEAAGSIAAFLPGYLQQIVTVGYFNAPLEADARAHEHHGA